MIKGEKGLIAHISDDGVHREESVAEHTQKTVFLCSEKGKKCGVPQLMSLCGLLHDMGKNKQSFSDYLQADENVRRKLKGTVKHASTGAKYIYDMHHEASGSRKYMVEMISYAIAAHHGLFDCVDNGQDDLFSKKLGQVDDYEEAIKNAERDYLGEYEFDKLFEAASDEFQLVWNKIGKVWLKLKPLLKARFPKDAKEMLLECKLFLLACFQRLMLSILIDSDWESTSDFMGNVDTLSKRSEFVGEEIFEQAGENFAEYMRKKKESVDCSKLTEKEKNIFDGRNALQEECIRFAEHPAGIYCLPIPTGGGKTLSSLAYALEYCKRHPETERIIYVSPFISITEQNAQVFRDAIGNDEWILEHHSAVVRSEETEQEDYRRNQSLKYDINWEEPFICTTFVQFMNTLFSDKKESIRRMHRLSNAVVIIDEVQAMPLKCVNTFNYMINFLNAVCNTNVILCTATQPALEEAERPICYSEPKYMIKNRSNWFDKFERVKICTAGMERAHTFESLQDEIVRQTAEYQSILVVLNTKSAVRKLYDMLKAQNIHTEYLTTNLCAEHRSDKIASIKKTLAKKQERIVVVSTNLIEAGVDISFECVYRSMAGLDSLAQTAGRCNRNGELEWGMIYLISLEGENSGNMEELQRNAKAAENVICQYNQSGESDSILMPRWMDEYYKTVYLDGADKMNFPIKALDTNVVVLLSKGFMSREIKNLMNQAYQTAGRAYRVIDDESFGVIVPYKEGGKLITAIQKTSDAAKIKALIRKAQRYTVNVRGSQLEKLEGFIQPINDTVPGIYMASVPGAYNNDYGIAPEWETLMV